MGVIIFRSRRRKRRAGALQRMLTRLVNRSYGVIALALVVVAGQHLISGEPRTFALPDRTPVPPVAIPSIDREATTAAIDPAMGRSVAATLEFCGSAARIDCVVDGDTIWLSGENIRIADIDTPEIFTPQCDAEQARGEAARRRLLALMNEGPFELRRAGRDADRYGRKLRTLHRGGRSLGDILVAEGLARRWDGARRGWCA